MKRLSKSATDLSSCKKKTRTNSDEDFQVKWAELGRNLCTKNSGSRNLRILKSRNLEISGSRNLRISESMNRWIFGSRNLGISKFWYLKISESQDLGISESENIEIPESRNRWIAESQKNGWKNMQGSDFINSQLRKPVRFAERIV